MAEIIILGVSSAVASQAHENTHLAVLAGDRLALVDCPGNPIVRLKQAGLDPLAVTDLVLTHFHPDHVSGAPAFLMSSWLLGRTRPLTIYGLPDPLERFQKMMDLYQWQTWSGFYPVTLHTLPEQEMAVLLNAPQLRILASPVRHMIPAAGLRFEFPTSGRAAAHSSDTGPCEAVVRLAEEADVLIHEATGAYPGHTSAAQAGEIASQARAKALYLIHYHAENQEDAGRLVAEARQHFAGPVELAQDFMRLVF